MKKNLLSLAAVLSIGGGVMWGVPACPDPGTVKQPDGREITVFLHGDEFVNFLTTVDGYTLVRNAEGVYTYAGLDASGNLVAGHIAAADPSARDASTNVYLSGVQRYLAPQLSSTALEMRADRTRMTVGAGQRGDNDYEKFKGLVILVEFNDCSFSRTDAATIFTDMVTKKNFDGFMSNDAIPSKINYTGSVRDYFYDNSHGQFDPDFDVVGPVKVPYSVYYANKTTNAQTLVREAAKLAGELVDFNKYDTNKDGIVDMFYVIFAGGGSNFSGNDERLVWPHAWSASPAMVNGVKLGRYACSTELYGRPETKKIDGIGTICHEFSHVLGLMDEYDTDYNSNGLSHHPGQWSLMASGSYLNYAITPCGYSLLERYQSGFTLPMTLREEGTYTLSDIDSVNFGYKIPLPYRNDEYWLLENRRKTGNKWNAYIPGEGMLVFRVDSTDTKYWDANVINAFSGHNFYEMVRASNNTASADLPSDPFPGSNNITQLTPVSTPPLVAWNLEDPNHGLFNIRQLDNGDISFDYKEIESTDTRLEDWEEIVTATPYETRLKGKVARWDFENAEVGTPDAQYCNGKKALGMVKSSIATVGPIWGQAKTVQFTMSNSSTRSAYFQLQYKDENGNWMGLFNTSDVGNIPLPAGESVLSTYILPAGVRKNMTLRVKISQGDSSNKIWLDDFAVRMVKNDEYLGMQDAGFNTTGWSVNGTEITVNGDEGERVTLYSLTGVSIAESTISGGIATVRAPGHGVYILVSGHRSIKISL